MAKLIEGPIQPLFTSMLIWRSVEVKSRQSRQSKKEGDASQKKIAGALLQGQERQAVSARMALPQNRSSLKQVSQEALPGIIHYDFKYDHDSGCAQIKA